MSKRVLGLFFRVNQPTNLVGLGDSRKENMRLTSHAMGTAFVQVLESGEEKVAAMNYTKRHRTTIRLPMGKGKKTKRENLTDTQVREATQEAAKDQGNFSYKFVFPRLVYYFVVSDDNNGPDKGGDELHLKAFMVARVTKGELRDFQHLDREFDSDTGKPILEEDEILGPLVYYEIRDLLNQMSAPRRGLCVHISAVLATLVALATKYPRVESYYRTIVNRTDVLERVRISEQYKDEVTSYVQLAQAT